MLVGHCPGCGRDDVPVLAPRRTPDRRGRALPWRRKQHALAGDLGKLGAKRCRYPVTLTVQEIPEHDRWPVWWASADNPQETQCD